MSNTEAQKKTKKKKKKASIIFWRADAMSDLTPS